MGAQPSHTLSLRDVRFSWPATGAFGIEVPQLDLASGESALLLGQSGSGKSTLLSLICGIVLPDSGDVAVIGQKISALRPSARDRFRAETIGLVFQQFNLLPYASVADNILLPLRFAPARRARVDDPLREAARLCRALDLPDAALGQSAGLLSVGQQQRVAVARALIGAPPLIVADEPTSALDAETQTAFLDLLFTQVRAVGARLLMVSHDPRLGARFDRVLQISTIVRPLSRSTS